MVVAAIRRNSLQNEQQSSPMMQEEKKLNISNLSDLVPEDPIPERLNDTEEDLYTRMMRPGELNEVVEVEEDEDVSEDVLPSPRQKTLPICIHSRSGSATILDSQNSRGFSSKKKEVTPYMMVNAPVTSEYVEPPSMNESS